MSSILNVSPVAVPTAPAPPAPKAQPAAAAPAPSAQPTEAQLLQEPISQLTQQAQAGNQLAIQLLAQEQAANTPMTAAAASGASGINILA